MTDKLNLVKEYIDEYYKDCESRHEKPTLYGFEKEIENRIRIIERELNR